ncbi:hypothetical protein [Arthrobacter flavus]|uniref:GtrA-like protein domain-containing protein n=1 Tax=Arthrobacter flavus TaxID=95172 RepID=A0ABW4QBH8_9MICC
MNTSPQNRHEEQDPESLLVRKVSEGKFWAMVLTAAAQGAVLVLAAQGQWWAVAGVLATGGLHYVWFRDAMWGARNRRPSGQIAGSLSISFLINAGIQTSFAFLHPVNSSYAAVTVALGILAFLAHAALRYTSSKVVTRGP